MPALIDHTGQRFGRRVVIERAQGSGAARWLCRCDCGTRSIVPGQALRKGQANSCGCSPLRDDLVGQRFGRLVVLARDKNSLKWKCLCTCGNTTLVDGSALKRGTASCGCFQREWARAKIKHSARTVARIHELRKRDLGYDTISRAVGVPKSTVRDICKGITRTPIGTPKKGHRIRTSAHLKKGARERL